MLATAIKKAKCGCLRIPSPLLIGSGNAGPTAETVQKVGDLACVESMTDTTPARTKAATPANQAQWTRIPKLVQNLVQVPLRNTFVKCLHEANDGPSTLTQWCQMGADKIRDPTTATITMNMSSLVLYLFPPRQACHANLFYDWLALTSSPFLLIFLLCP